MDKRKLIAALAVGGSIAMVSLFGGDDDPIPGSYRGGYYGGTGSYRGGAESPWTGETRTIMFVMDTTLVTGHDLAEYDADYAEAAASGGVFELGSAEVPEFAYALLDSNHLGMSAWTSDAQNHLYTGLMPTESASWELTTYDGTNDPQILLTYIDWTKYIPAGSTIVSARLGLLAASWDLALRDTISSTLMGEPNDNQWMWSKGITAGLDVAPMLSHASYTHQLYSPGPNANDYPDTISSYEWDPALSERDYFWVHSNWSTWSGGHNISPSLYTGYYEVDLYRPVQGAVNGETNHGTMTMFRETSATAAYKYFGSFSVRPGQPETKKPWFTVTYIDRPYASPLPNGKDFAFVFTNYDGNDRSIDAHAAAYAGRDGQFTAYIAKIHADKDTLDSNYYSFSKVEAWIDAGIEVSVHDGWSYTYPDPGFNEFGFRKWHIARLMPDTNSTFYQDSLRLEIDSTWLHDWSEAYDGDRREDEPLFGNGIGLPQGAWSPEVSRILMDSSYRGMSFHNLLTPNSTGVGDFWSVANTRPGFADTMRYFVFPSDGGRAKNMRVVSFTITAQSIVGQIADSNITEDEVRFNMRKEIQRTLAQGQTVIALFAHDLKTNPQTVHPDGIDGDELGWMNAEVDANNGCTMTVIDYCLTMQQWATPVVNPFANSVTDTFQYYTAEDEVWYEPDGVDGRFIRGLR